MPNSQGQPASYPGSSSASASASASAGGGQQDQAGPQPYGEGQQGQQSAAGGDTASGGFDTAQGSASQRGDIDFSEESGAATSGSTMDRGGGLPSAASHEEQVAILDRQLEGSMSEYDGMILRERRNILSRGGETGSEQQVETFDRDVAYYDEGDLGGAEGEGDESWPDASAGGGMGGEDGETQVAQAGGHPYGSDAGGPGRANDRGYAPPADIPSGDDDDVVARQIREAAMHEGDPELREKLWDEYRKYKEQTR